MTDTPASPPCYAHELLPASDAPADIQTWRKGQRTALIAMREQIPASERARIATDVAGELDAMLCPGPGMTISLYWPFKAELDLRGWMAEAHGKGARIALPLVEAKGHPLRFREWYPGCAMERGVWNILQPAGTAELVPETVIAPLVGFDTACFRLGYGGGFFDRTLAALGPGVRAIGVGTPGAAMPTIHPQWHDVPMQAIVTGRGRVLRLTGGGA